MEYQEALAIGQLLGQLDEAVGVYDPNLRSAKERVEAWAGDAGIGIQDRKIAIIKGYRNLATRRRVAKALEKLEHLSNYDVVELIQYASLFAMGELPSLRTLARELVESNPDLLTNFLERRQRGD